MAEEEKIDEVVVASEPGQVLLRITEAADLGALREEIYSLEATRCVQGRSWTLIRAFKCCGQ